jgi:hypothetical protein
VVRVSPSLGGFTDVCNPSRHNSVSTVHNGNKCPLLSAFVHASKRLPSSRSQVWREGLVVDAPPLRSRVNPSVELFISSVMIKDERMVEMRGKDWYVPA